MNAGGFPAVVHALVFKSLVDDSTCVGKVTAARCYRKGVVVHGVSISTKQPQSFWLTYKKIMIYMFGILCAFARRSAPGGEITLP